jgi:uncharacterized SAM-binding protein YcdF (DUF218 family)
MFRYLGFWLVLDEPLEKSAAVVVMGGGFPYRAAKAAEIYRDGWAKEVWLTQGSKNDRDRDLEAFGMPQTAEHESGRWLLRKLGVPEDRIKILPQPVDNTFTELKVIREYAMQHGSPLIVVTSKQHTRRVRVIWNAMVGKDMRIAVRSTPREAYDEDHWWRTTTDALATFREAFGIANAWAGFPIAPREH